MSCALVPVYPGSRLDRLLATVPKNRARSDGKSVTFAITSPGNVAPGKWDTLPSFYGKATDLAEQAPELVGQLAIDAYAGLAATTLYAQIKRFFGECAFVQRGHGDVKGAERFEKASTHWMRH
jgi:hypothetical protein